MPSPCTLDIILTEVVNSEITVKKNNLKSWQPGISGNPKGRPKGSRNIKKVIQDLLNDQSVATRLPLRLPRATETPLEAIVYTLVVKAIRGDVRASEVLLKHSVDKEPVAIEGGFFSADKLVIEVVRHGDVKSAPLEPTINGATGQMVGYEDLN